MTVVAERADLDLGIALAHQAERPWSWFGLGRRELGELRLVVVRGDAAFESLARGVPGWGAGLAFPRARTVVVRADAGDPVRILRHELAHVVLHDAVRGRVPLWFDEGYAAVAAGEWDRLDALRLNFTVARGRIPEFPELDRALRGGHGTAEAAYALAAAAVLELARRHPTGRLEPLLVRLGRGEPFDEAVLATTGLTVGRFELVWQKEVRRRYGLLVWTLAGGLWVVVAVVALVAVRVRRRRDAPRRAALDVGWEVPEAAAPEPLDPAEPRP